MLSLPFQRYLSLYQPCSSTERWQVPITSLTRWQLFIGCAFQKKSNIRSPYWHSEFFTVMEVHRRNWDRWCQYTVFTADGRFVLQAVRHQSSFGTTRQAITRRYPCFPSRWAVDLESPDQRSLPSLNTPFVASSKRGCSRSPFRSSSTASWLSA